MPNHTIFRFHNVNLMRQESNHFTAMNREMNVNMSSFSNSVNLLRKYLFSVFNPECWSFQASDSLMLSRDEFACEIQ